MKPKGQYARYPYRNGICENCIYHYLLGGDESRCSTTRLGMSDVMCAQIAECQSYVSKQTCKKANNLA